MFPFNFQLSSANSGFLDGKYPQFKARDFIYETKTTHSKEIHSTWFGDDVIRFAPAAGRAEGWWGWGAKSIVTCEKHRGKTYAHTSTLTFPVCTFFLVSSI